MTESSKPISPLRHRMIDDTTLRKLSPKTQKTYIRDNSSLRLVSSSGVMWTRTVKEALLRHNDQLLLVDGFALSEAIGPRQLRDDQGSDHRGSLLHPRSEVFTEDHREVLPGSGESGMVAVRGNLPVGYYKDPEGRATGAPALATGAMPAGVVVYRRLPSSGAR
jgi:hypothetical protein